VPDSADAPLAPTLPSADSEMGAPIAASPLPRQPKAPAPQPEAGGLY